MSTLEQMKMRPYRILQFVLAAAIGVGCSGAILDEGCVQSIGGASAVPIAPGEADYVLVRVQTDATLPAAATGVAWWVDVRNAGGQRNGFEILPPGQVTTEDVGFIFPCNITTVTPGDVTNPNVPGATLIFGSNTTTDIPPLGQVLQNGVHFRCGDTVTFSLVNDSSSLEGYKVVWVVHSGQGQTGPFSGPDAFALFEREEQEFREQYAPYLP